MIHGLRNRTLGKYALETRCDCCGLAVYSDHVTDEEVCGLGDGPGFYLCGRQRCVRRYAGLDVETRRSLFQAGRQRNEEN